MLRISIRIHCLTGDFADYTHQARVISTAGACASRLRGDRLMIEGGCLCGKLRYKIKSTPLATVVCHCRDCQKQSGSAFSVNLVVPMADIEITGTETAFHCIGESGGKVERRFCADCGSPIRSLLGNMPGIAAIKAGTLDIPPTQTPNMQIWRRSAQGWLDKLPARASFETSPPAA